MNFSSLSFFCFFFIFYIIYWLLPRRTFRQCFLLLGSAIFCGWLDIYFFLLLFGAASICYFAGMFIAKGKSQAILVIAISLLLANLAFFKYFNFFSESFSELLHFVGLYANTNTLDIILPIGISFYTFQAISYIVDVFQRKIAPEKNFLKLILYFSFFPRFIAGPIVRADDFLPQLSRDVFLKSRDFTIGVKLFLQGFIYKSIFADNMAPFIDKVYAKVTLYNNLTLTMATIGYYCQIYFDFAGYSLMAIGIARLLGYKILPNFNFPYIATSISEFWRRWHISLSTWLRDYLYIPMGGNRQGLLKENRNIMMTMLLGGLWHGASWNFVLWGGLHGVALVFLRFYNRLMGWKELRPVKRDSLAWFGYIMFVWALTQTFVLMCWIPFRATSIDETWIVLKAFLQIRNDNGLISTPIPYALLILPILVDTFVIRLKRKPKEASTAWSLAQFAMLGIIIAFSLLMLPLEVKNFIYVQF